MSGIQDADRQPSPLEVVRLVAAREITTKLRDKAFLVSVAVMLLVVATSVIVPLVLNRDDDRPRFTVAAVGPQAATVAAAARVAGAEAVRQADQRRQQDDAPEAATRPGESPAPPAELTVQTVADLAAAEARLRSEDVDAVLAPGPDGTLALVGLTEVDPDLSRLVGLAAQSQNLTTALAAGGTAGAEVQRLLTAPPPAERLLEPPPPNANLSLLLGLAFAGLFFMTSFIFGLMIAQSVVEEKQSRVVELLVAAVPVRLLLLGKVAGSTLLAFGQVVVLFAVGLAGASIAGQSAAVSLLPHSGGWFLVFFALGFTMLSCVWAAAGALSSRQEDLQATTAPLQLLIIAPFFAAIYINDPGRWLTVLSYIPFTAPLSMPRRLLIGDAAWWEPLLSAIGVLATGAVLVIVAARLYEGALLRTSGRTSLRTAWSGTRTPAAPAGAVRRT